MENTISLVVRLPLALADSLMERSKKSKTPFDVVALAYLQAGLEAERMNKIGKVL